MRRLAIYFRLTLRWLLSRFQRTRKDLEDSTSDIYPLG